ncbi:hypothetical protein [Aromatoleum anaerobium]|nr:hypothetical protein [Aromatoleum anaerobium]MCK0507374.1 hypothetical protein [Aromatoleum anaerobium]
MNDSASLDQLPHAEDFPKEYPATDDIAPWALREVLGVACLKLYRPWGDDGGAHIVIDGAGGWLLDLASIGYAMHEAHLAPLGRVLEMALCAPHRLPVLLARIDALGNDDLHRMAMAAVQGLPVPDVFEELMG